MGPDILLGSALRAPDIAVGNVPDAPGWAKGAPTLAVEYADRKTDEDDLQRKIAQLFAAGHAVRVGRASRRSALEHVRGEAREAGRAEGREQGLRVAVETACSLLGIELDEEKRGELERADAVTLERLLESLRSRRAWPAS